MAWLLAAPRLGMLALVFGLACASAASRAGAEPTEAGAAPETFAELLAGFARTTGLEARFEEEKYLKLLAVPLRSSGRLYYSPPSTLLRRVEEPRRRDVLISQNQVRIADDAGQQTIDLGARNEVRPLVESMLWIFTGDLASLERTYRVDYEVLDAQSGGQGRWQVHLVPRREPLSRIVRELRVAGNGGIADTLELVETSGDRTLTHISEANPRRRFDPEERRELFGVGAR